MGLNVQLVIIDPEGSFMDDGNLPVPGAHEDMRRLAKLIDERGDRFSQIQVSLDAHHVLDVGHPEMWKDETGVMPQLGPSNPAMPISHDQIANGLWVPRYANLKLPALDDKTVLEYMLYYSAALEEQVVQGDGYPLMVYAEHCLIGSPGMSVQPELYRALVSWERRRGRSVNYITKGSNPWTEHYGFLMANVPMANDPTTGINVPVLEIVRTADIIAFAGEALSHCFMASLNQVADNIGEEHVKKFHVLRDCTSPIPAVPGVPELDFPAKSERWLERMQHDRGVTVTTSEEFLA